MNSRRFSGEQGKAGGTDPAHPRILVIGLGNPILGDDGVGWRVAEAVREKLATQPAGEMPPVEVDCLSLGGLGLMERMLGYQRVILVDAANTGRHSIGTVTCLPLDALADPVGGHLASSHDTSLQNALEVGRLMGAQLPDEIRLVLVETEFQADFSTELTPPVAAAIPEAEGMVLAILAEWLREV